MNKKTFDNKQLTLMITLVWAIGWGLSWAVGWSLVRFIGLGYSFTVGGQLGGLVAGMIAGAIGGIGTAIALSAARPNGGGLKTYQTVLLALGWTFIVFFDWADGFVIAAPAGYAIEFGSGGPLSGLLGGLLTAGVCWWANHALRWYRLLFIVAGWAIGFTIAGFIAWTFGFNTVMGYVLGPIYHSDSGWVGLTSITVLSGLCGALAGLMGGAVTLNQFGAAAPQERVSTPVSGAVLINEK